MIAPSVRIFVCRESQDLRRSFDGLALAARQLLGEDPRSGAVFCFLNRRLDRIKCLWWDRNGYCLLYKRLSAARFVVPAGEGVGTRIDGAALVALLGGVARVSRRREARRLH